MALEISWGVIFKICIGGLFTYAVLPLTLAIRDLLLLKAIEKWILNENLNSLIRICENDRWHLENEYQKDTEVNIRNDGNIYKIDDKEVTEEKFKSYERGKKFHENRFYPTNSKITMRSNLLVWLTKHYKMTEFVNPIPQMKEGYYNMKVKEHERKNT